MDKGNGGAGDMLFIKGSSLGKTIIMTDVNNNETFQRGEWVEGSFTKSFDTYEEAEFITTAERTDYKYLCYKKCNDGSLVVVGYRFIRKIPQPQNQKKTVLKAPAITTDGFNFRASKCFYSSYEDAKFCLEGQFHSFPAKIRMKDGTEQELWFVCEEE